MLRSLAIGRALARRRQPPLLRRHMHDAPENVEAKGVASLEKAAILRSSVGKTARRAFSLEGTLSAHLPEPHCRLLQTGHTTDSIGQVDHLVKKVDEVARKAVLAEYTQGLVKEQKTQVVSPTQLGIAMPWLLGICCAGVFTAGYCLGFAKATEKGYQKSARKGLEA